MDKTWCQDIAIAMVLITAMTFYPTLSLATSPIMENSSSTETLARNEWLTFSANIDFSYRNTQFFQEKYDEKFLQWDSRLELWLPPYRNNFSWGPYVRFAGIEDNYDQPWANGILAGPGFGLQVYPFSLDSASSHAIGMWLGPLRFFAEANRQDYRGSDVDEQVRAGLEYFLGLHVNENAYWWWAEIYAELIWQSANEFDEDYNSIICADALRTGIRIPNEGQISIISMVTPYIVLESSLTDNEDYYWENRLLLGGGVRFAPDLGLLLPHNLSWLNRFFIFAEYLNAAWYYQDSAPSSTPDDDFRVGIAVTIGDYYRSLNKP